MTRHLFSISDWLIKRKIFKDTKYLISDANTGIYKFIINITFIEKGCFEQNSYFYLVFLTDVKYIQKEVILDRVHTSTYISINSSLVLAQRFLLQFGKVKIFIVYFYVVFLYVMIKHIVLLNCDLACTFYVKVVLPFVLFPLVC